MSDNILIRVRSYMGAGVDSSKYYNKTEVDEKLSNVTVDLSSYYTKQDVDAMMGDVETILATINGDSV